MCALKAWTVVDVDVDDYFWNVSYLGKYQKKNSVWDGKMLSDWYILYNEAATDQACVADCVPNVQPLQLPRPYISYK